MAHACKTSLTWKVFGPKHGGASSPHDHLAVPPLVALNWAMGHGLFRPSTAQGLWGLAVLTLGIRFFRLAAVLASYRLVLHTLRAAGPQILNFLVSPLSITAFLAWSAHLMFGHFSAGFSTLGASLHATMAISAR